MLADTQKFFENLEGGAGSASELVTPEGIVLPDQDCKLVILSNFNIPDLNSFNYDVAPGDIFDSKKEIFWGFNGTFTFQLFPASQTDYIPVKNLKNISLRTHPAVSRKVYYTYFF